MQLLGEISGYCAIRGFGLVKKMGDLGFVAA
jgi:hypothetical protein